MISVDQALSEVLSRRRTPASEPVALGDALGRVTAKSITSPVDLPLFDNSSMDGYAVGDCDRDRWRVVGEVRAGAAGPDRIEPGDAVRVFTGAKLPAGTAAVLMQESARVESGSLHAASPARPGAHMRLRGEELRVGSVLINGGTRLTPPACALLAGMGLDTVDVQARPRVTVVCTGDEIVEPGQSLGDGQVFESNGTSVSMALQSLGFTSAVQRLPDDKKTLETTFRRVSETQGVLVTTGGVSVGDYDHVVSAAKSAGFELVFHGVAMKPGKPIAFGVHPSGCTWFGLPGNPMSAMVGLLLFVAPFLGAPLRRLSLPLVEPVSCQGDREEYLPGRLTESGHVQVARTIGSHSQGGLVDADVLVRVPVGLSLGPADSVEVLLLPWRSTE